MSKDTQTVLNTWREQYCSLLNPVTNGIPEISPNNNEFVRNEISSDICETDITRFEVMKALTKAKNGKAIGHDGIPTEVLRNESAITYLQNLFCKCFRNGLAPTVWCKGIINPIPKGGNCDKRDPLSYRGITIASSVYKLYASILNNRLTKWSEENRLLADCQNGFRKGRSCQDHLTSLATLIDVRKRSNKSTFIAFVDYSKAFDRVDRDLLWRKLGLRDGRFKAALKSLYRDVECCIRMNGFKTDWFNVDTGLKQGCLLSPQLFSLFADDLNADLRDIYPGINYNGERVNMLMTYA